MGTLLAIAQRKKTKAPMECLDETTISFSNGVGTDSRGKKQGKRQVTVLTKESWDKASELNGSEIPWTTRRANLLISGFNLENSTGKHLIIGDVKLEITGELEPCKRMDEQVEGLTQILTPYWRGGVCCKIISEGKISIGETVTLTE
jgi:MOSC domain-containing protein YiiM